MKFLKIFYFFENSLDGGGAIFYDFPLPLLIQYRHGTAHATPERTILPAFEWPLNKYIYIYIYRYMYYSPAVINLYSPVTVPLLKGYVTAALLLKQPLGLEASSDLNTCRDFQDPFPLITTQHLAWPWRCF
jgi:hypothetical protein